ncbi:unnamed protein product [Closterium sp. NIES-53]
MYPTSTPCTCPPPLPTPNPPPLPHPGKQGHIRVCAATVSRRPAAKNSPWPCALPRHQHPLLIPSSPSSIPSLAGLTVLWGCSPSAVSPPVSLTHTTAHCPHPAPSHPRPPSLSRRLDSLMGLFAIGCEPSASADPFGLRRSAYGLVSCHCANSPLPQHLLRLTPAPTPA